MAYKKISNKQKQVVCKNCGSTFEVSVYSRTLYCSKECLLKRHSKAVSRHYSKNKEKIYKGRKEYLRHNYTSTKNGVVRARKRQRPDGICELCIRPTPRLEYHHWDDNNMLRGMWVCRSCHVFATRAENKGYQIYQELKRQIEEEGNDT